MKSHFVNLLFIFLLIFVLYPDMSIARTSIDVTASAAILMDYTTGNILYQKNAMVPRPPASTTKILTAVLALEKGNPNQVIVASPKAAKVGGSSIWLAPGESHTLKDLLYGILLSSGNDASVAVAENLAGSERKFAEWMTLKARELGAKNTNFLNCNGLPEKGHYSTAYDLAMIARYALHNPTFAEIVKTKKRTMDWPGHKWDRVMYNHNKLLWRYEYADGVKTGYTRQAGQCLVSSATKDDHRLIAVVLNSKSTYDDSKKLFNYGFGHFQLLTVASPEKKLAEIEVSGGVADQVPVAANQSVQLIIPKGSAENVKIDLDLPNSIPAPVERLQPIGEAEVKLGNKILEKIPLVTAAPVPKKGLWQIFWEWVKSLLGS